MKESFEHLQIWVSELNRNENSFAVLPIQNICRMAIHDFTNSLTQQFPHG